MCVCCVLIIVTQTRNVPGRDVLLLAGCSENDENEMQRRIRMSLHGGLLPQRPLEDKCPDMSFLLLHSDDDEDDNNNKVDQDERM